jgi:hypothetical protein
VATLDSLVNKALSRRNFLAGAGAVAATSAVVGCSNNTAATIPTTTSSSYTDADVLNFALNLEYLEAEFYLRAATGSGLASTDTTAGSASPYTSVGTVTTTGNIAVGAVPGLTTAQQQILYEIAYEEQEHVRFLRSALGSAAIPRPALDLTFFSTLAMVAGITTTVTGAGAFSPYTSFQNFLIGAFIFEDVGVTAYSGAAPLISAAGVASGYLTAAAGILAVEAYHAAYVRTTLTAMAVGNTANAAYVTIANQVADGRQQRCAEHDRIGRDKARRSNDDLDAERDRPRRIHHCCRLQPHRQPGTPHRVRQRNGWRKERRLLPERHKQHLRHHHSISNHPKDGINPMANQETQLIDDIILKSRRKLLTLGAASIAGLAISAAAPKAANAATGYTDNDILNFALNLEFLEANFYYLSAFGCTIDKPNLAAMAAGAPAAGIPITGSVGTAGTVSGGSQVPFAISRRWDRWRWHSLRSTLAHRGRRWPPQPTPTIRPATSRRPSARMPATLRSSSVRMCLRTWA